MNIAFLGTGLMGGPMVRRLVAGHRLTVWNRSSGRAEALADVATVSASAVDAVRDADVVISMVIDGPATRALLEGDGVLDAMKPGALLINMASVEPSSDRALAAEAAKRGIAFLDAPVSGGVKGATEGTLAIFVGGEAANFERARPVFAHLGRPTLLGPTGSGQVAKLANQLIVAVTIGAVAEAFRLAEQSGCDPALLRDALRGGFAESRILELHGARMVTGDFVPGGRSVAQLKDLRNALDLAAETHTELPLSKTVKAAFQDFVDNKNGGEMDHAAYFVWLKTLSQEA